MQALCQAASAVWDIMMLNTAESPLTPERDRQALASKPVTISLGLFKAVDAVFLADAPEEGAR